MCLYGGTLGHFEGRRPVLLCELFAERKTVISRNSNGSGNGQAREGRGAGRRADGGQGGGAETFWVLGRYINKIGATPVLKDEGRQRRPNERQQRRDRGRERQKKNPKDRDRDRDRDLEHEDLLAIFLSHFLWQTIPVYAHHNTCKSPHRQIN